MEPPKKWPPAEISKAQLLPLSELTLWRQYVELYARQGRDMEDAVRQANLYVNAERDRKDVRLDATCRMLSAMALHVELDDAPQLRAALVQALGTLDDRLERAGDGETWAGPYG